MTLKVGADNTKQQKQGKGKQSKLSKAKKAKSKAVADKDPEAYHAHCVQNMLLWARRADLAGGEHCILLWHNRERYHPPAAGVSIIVTSRRV